MQFTLQGKDQTSTISHDYISKVITIPSSLPIIKQGLKFWSSKTAKAVYLFLMLKMLFNRFDSPFSPRNSWIKSPDLVLISILSTFQKKLIIHVERILKGKRCISIIL